MAIDMRIVGERRAWRWCELALDRMRREPDRVRRIASANLDLVERKRTCGTDLIARWRGLMACEADDIAAVVLADTDEGQLLRSVAPFAGVLDNAERWQIHRDIHP